MTIKQENLDRVVGATLTAFLSDFGRAKVVPLIQKLPESVEELLDLEKTVVLPLPAEAPADAPLVIFVGKDPHLQITMSPRRVDLQFNYGPQDLGSIDDAEHFLKMGCILRSLVEKSGSEVRRFGATLVRVGAEIDAKSVAEHFCNSALLSSALSRPQNFELHTHKSYLTKAGLNVNSWVRHRAISQSEKQFLIVEQDINTLENEDHKTVEIEGFFSSISSEFGDCIQAYYPS